MWSTSILSYNIWQTVPEPIRFNGQYERCKQLVQYFKNNKHICTDIIAFQELMVTNHKNYIINELYSIGYKYHSDILYDSTRLGKFVTGGIVILSKYPIIKQKNYIFPYSYGADTLSSKGIVFCRINIKGNILNVFATHVQAILNKKCINIQQLQVRCISEFIKSQNIPSDECVILCGDFNVDEYSNTALVRNIFKNINFKIIPSNGKYSIDPFSNQLVGNDDTSLYISSNYPNGCYSQYLKTLQCSCCPRELVDYISYSLKHQSPVEFKSEILPIKSNVLFEVQLNQTTFRKVRDFSDHYPVYCELTFNNPTPFNDRKINSTNVQFKELNFLNIVICAALVLVYLVVLSLVFLVKKT